MTPKNENAAEAYTAAAREQLAKAAKVIEHCLDQLTDEQIAWRPQAAMNSIGKALVERCLSKLRSLGIQKCNIFVYRNNDDGSRFCQRTGWLDRNDLKVMQRPLARKQTHDDLAS